MRWFTKKEKTEIPADQKSVLDLGFVKDSHHHVQNTLKNSVSFLQSHAPNVHLLKKDAPAYSPNRFIKHLDHIPIGEVLDDHIVSNSAKLSTDDSNSISENKFEIKGDNGYQTFNEKHFDQHEELEHI